MAPTTDLKPWQTQGEAKKRAVREMFAQIAPTYDAANSIMSAWGHKRWRSQAVAQIDLKLGESVLDVCCGTGDFLIAARERIGPDTSALGVDFCAPMLDIAAKKVDPNSRLTLGDALDLPVASDQFDAVTIGWGLRNVPDVGRAISEIARVLRPGGRFVCLDMSRPKGFMGRIGNTGYHVLVPLLGRLLGQRDAYAYLPKSTERFPDANELSQMFSEAGFTNVQYRPIFLGLIAMHWGAKS